MNNSVKSSMSSILSKCKAFFAKVFTSIGKVFTRAWWKQHGFATLGWGYIALILILMYLPILVIIVYSFIGSKVIGSEGQFTFALYESLFNNTEIMSATANTFIIAIVSSLCATFIGTLAAIGIYYMKRFKAVLQGLNQITIVNAEIVTAVAFMLLFIFLRTVNIGIPDGYPTLIITHTVIAIPYVILSVTPRLTQLDPNMYEASLDLGAGHMRTLFTVILPQLIPGMVSGLALSFTLSLDDFLISNFNRGGIHTISTLIYSQIHKRGIDPAFRALSSIIFVAILTVLIVFNVVKNKKAKKKAQPSQR